MWGEAHDNMRRSGKRADPYYSTASWRRLRAERLRIDNYTCVVPGCGQLASVVDHITRRQDGGADDLANLRSLCRQHDNQVKEAPSGTRRSGGDPYLKGSDAGGRPIDPMHPWNRGRGV